MRELLVALGARPDHARYICYARSRWEHQLDERFTWSLVPAPDPYWHARVARAASGSCDVFLSSNSYLTVPLLRIPAVAIVYDLITFNPTMLPNRRSTAIERLTLRAAVARANALVCISETTRRELIERYPAAAAKTTVAPLGVSPQLLAPAQSVAVDLPDAGFVLAVGTLEPRKNLPRLVGAYASLPETLQVAHPLVVVGARGWRTGETLAALRGLRSRCIMLGAVSDAALSELYRRCAVFAYPSLGEGFGLPVLEAMAAGAAVLTSDLQVLHEVGGDAVEYVDPRSVASIADGLRGLLEQPERRGQLGELGRRRAAAFSWDSTAAVVMAALKSAAGRG